MRLGAEALEADMLGGDPLLWTPPDTEVSVLIISFVSFIIPYTFMNDGQNLFVEKKG